MAKRYGGQFSPGQRDQGDAPRAMETAARAPSAGRLNIMAVVAVLAGVPAFFGGPGGLAIHLGGAALLLFAWWLTREGVKAQAAYDARAVARRPAIPRKILGSLSTALGLGALGLGWDGAIAAPVFAIAGGALHFAAFGADPLRNKSAEGFDAYESDRVARVVEEAETRLAEMRAAIEPVRDRTIKDKVERFAATARALFRQVEEDPRDLTAVRRYLGVYLQGARDATAKFAAFYQKTGDESAKAEYEALLDDLDRDFAARTQKLTIDDRTGMDVEIEVLRDRLAREGVPVPNSDGEDR